MGQVLQQRAFPSVAGQPDADGGVARWREGPVRRIGCGLPTRSQGKKWRGRNPAGLSIGDPERSSNTCMQAVAERARPMRAVGLRQRRAGTVAPLSDQSLCLRSVVRRQAQAAFGGRFARLDPGQPPEAWLGIGFRDRSGSPSRGCVRRGGYLAWARFGSNSVCRCNSTQARPSKRSATPRSARPCVLPRRRSAAYCSRLFGSCCVATRAQ
jgi:hypothetical protein